MPIPQKIIKYLDSAKVKYEAIEHRIVYTAFDKAKTLRLKPNIIGKTLILKVSPKDLAIVLIPANKNLDKNKFKKTAKTRMVDFISERLMKNKFKGIKAGAIPPFGNLWKMPTFVDGGLLKNPKIIINAGHYNWSIKISSAGLKKLIPNLIIGSFGKIKK